MDGVIRGNPITREAHYLLDGVLIDPASPRITIFDPLHVAVVFEATPTRISTGIYQYPYNVAVDAMLGVWDSQWQGTISGQAKITDDYFQVYPVGAISPVPSSDYTYNLSTAVGKVRMYIDDRDMSNVSTAIPLEQRSAIFSDQEIQTFLDQTAGGGLVTIPDSAQNVLFAAAQALTTIAGNRSLLVTARRIGRTTIDYSQARADLLRQAEQLFDLANKMSGGIIPPADGIAEQAFTDFSLRQVLWNARLREGPP